MKKNKKRAGAGTHAKAPKRQKKAVSVSRHPSFATATGDAVFRLADGRQICNLLELAVTLETIPEEVFRHHVNAEKNDFSSWIRDVFMLESLADAVRNSPRIEMQARISRHLLNELIK